jgi:8-oxo-dGTP pyrophosphatase MutT (NUDIX family)
MTGMLRRDPRVDALAQAIDARPVATSSHPRPDRRMEAAVSVVLRMRERLDFLLIKRATSPRDPWSGQIALPGGRYDATDPDLTATAMRETLEETGVDLMSSGVRLGRLLDVNPATPRLPKMRIAPFAFAVPPQTEALVASHELEQVFWVPVDALLSPESVSSVTIRFDDGERDFPSYALVGEHVWGLTHRILADFRDLCAGVDLATSAG